MEDPNGVISMVWPFLLMGIFIYFMLYRPQKKEQQKRQELLDSLKVGNKVVTIGGVYGELTRVGETDVTLKVAENVELEMLRSAIARNVSKEA